MTDQPATTKTTAHTSTSKTAARRGSSKRGERGTSQACRSAEATTTGPPASHLNVAVLRGRVAAPPQSYDARDASRVISFDLVTVGDAGREVTPVSWFDPPAWADELDAGDEVIVVGRVRKRFVRVGRTTRPFTDVVTHHAARAARRRQVARLLADAASLLTAG